MSCTATSYTATSYTATSYTATSYTASTGGTGGTGGTGDTGGGSISESQPFRLISDLRLALISGIPMARELAELMTNPMSANIETDLPEFGGTLLAMLLSGAEFRAQRIPVMIEMGEVRGKPIAPFIRAGDALFVSFTVVKGRNVDIYRNIRGRANTNRGAVEVLLQEFLTAVIHQRFPVNRGGLIEALPKRRTGGHVFQP